MNRERVVGGNNPQLTIFYNFLWLQTPKLDTICVEYKFMSNNNALNGF